jgi:hypothetical protein
MSIGRLLKACGWAETPAIGTDIATDRAEIPVKGCPRPGSTLFDDATLDALADAGVTVEETAGGITLHLPAGGGSISGMAFAQMFSEPLSVGMLAPEQMLKLADEAAPKRRQQDYLRHDPTKKHKGVRAWGKNARGRGR